MPPGGLSGARPGGSSGSVSIEWAGLGPELLLRLDRGLAEPLGSQLERELRAAIRSERLGAGERLPSSRELARELGVSGGWFRVLRAAARRRVPERPQRLGDTGGRRRRPRGTEIRRPARFAHAPQNRLPARSPGSDSFPRQDWMWAMREVSRTAPSHTFGYGDPRGSQRLREVLASYLRRVRGAVAIRIGSLSAPVSRRDSTWFRALARAGIRRPSPSRTPATPRITRPPVLGLNAIPVTVDELGIDVAQSARRVPARPS